MWVGLKTSHSGLMPRFFISAARNFERSGEVFMTISLPPWLATIVVASRVHISAPASMPLRSRGRSGHSRIKGRGAWIKTAREKPRGRLRAGGQAPRPDVVVERTDPSRRTNGEPARRGDKLSPARWTFPCRALPRADRSVGLHHQPVRPVVGLVSVRRGGC